MISFTPTQFIITVECVSNPVEEYLQSYECLIDLLQSEDEDFKKKRYNVLELMRQMLPEYKQVVK
jgi:hypothetical protein